MRTGERGIVILGFMGAGKTTVARALAHQLGREHADLDELIVQREGRSIRDIIDTDGEPRFRDFESAALADALCQYPGGVIALGGGTWTIPDNRTAIQSAGFVSVWLDAPFETCWHRISGSGIGRPLAPDQFAARGLFDARLAAYKLAEVPIHCTAQDRIDRIVALISELLSSPGGVAAS